VILETQEQRAALFKNLTPLEQAFLEGVDDPRGQASTVHILFAAMVQNHELFGIPVPTPEEVRHKRQVLKEVAKIEAERAAQGDTAFLDKETLCTMAEDRLRRERRGGGQSGSTTAPIGPIVD